MLSKGTVTRRQIAAKLGESALFLITSFSAIAVLFIFFFVIKNAIPFFQSRGFGEFFTRTEWYPSGDPAVFGALAIFFGSGMVTLLATVLAVPLALHHFTVGNP